MATASDRQSEAHTDEADEESVRPLLARANLLRMRNQWDEAITACTEALRRVPRSVSAHSLLGNIYESQAKYEDAIQWYVMASEIGPLNSADAARLDHLLQVQRLHLRTQELEAAAMPTPNKPAAEKTLDWIDRIFPPGRSDGLARMILAMGIGLAFIIALCAAFIYFYVSPRRDEPTLASVQQTALDPLVPAAPVLMTPTMSATPVSQSSPGTSAADGSAESAHSTSADWITPLRGKVTQALDGAGVTTVGVGAAPTGGVVSVDLSLPTMNGETQDHLRERSIRLASLSARTVALNAADSIQRVLVRLSLYGPGGSETGSTASAGTRAAGVIFLGEALLRPFREANVAGLPAADLLARFSSAQWYSAAVTSGTTPAPVPSAYASPTSPGTTEPTSIAVFPSPAASAAGPAPPSVAPTPTPTP